MAKSIRSKRKRKLRAERREKLKPKVKAKLEEILGLNDKKMIVGTEGCEGDAVEEAKEEILEIENQEETTNNEAEAVTENSEDVVMKSEDGARKKLGKKALQKMNKQGKLKRLTNKKKRNQKIFKW